MWRGGCKRKNDARPRRKRFGMEKRMNNTEKRFRFVGLLFLLGTAFFILAYALNRFPAENIKNGREEVGAENGAEEIVGAKMPGPLVQTTTQEEEYSALVHLELLRTPVNENGDMAQSVQNVLPSVVKLQTGNFSGSGIILEVRKESLLIASNRHQIQSREFSTVKLYNGESVSGRCVFLSDTYDLGFLEADISRLSYERRKELRCIALSETCGDALTRGTPMFFVGSTDGVACNIYEGTIADPWYYFDEFGSYMIYNYCKAKAGMSGGGTYDEHGHCIGMITGGADEETASLPMQSILEEWNHYISQ